jgi:hypothetical protein
MSTVRPDIACIDETCTALNVHDRAVDIAVPHYDWISMPIIAIVDGLLHVDPDSAPQPGEDHKR